MSLASPPTVQFSLTESGQIQIQYPEVPADRNYNEYDNTYGVYWCTNCKKDAGCSTRDVNGQF